MNFDLNKLLSFFKKQKKNTKREDFEDNDEDILENEETEESFDEMDSDEDFMDDEETKDIKTKDKNKTKKDLKSLINLKNKKFVVSAAVAGIVVVAGGAFILPMVMNYSGEKKAEEIGNISDINIQPTHRPHHHVVSNSNIHHISHHHTNNKNIYSNKKIGNNSNVHHVEKNKNNGLVVKNPALNQSVKKTVQTNVQTVKKINENQNKIAQINAQLENTSKNIKTIENHLIKAKLTGQTDPISLMDKTIIKNRNFDLYLQSQIQLMRKLISYYKQRAELQKTLELYKMAYKNQGQNTNTQNGENGIDKQTQKMEIVLRSIVAPLQDKINQLQKQLKENKNSVKQKNNAQNNADFNKMSSVKLNDLNIFAKNNKYIAVIHTDNGDKIFEEGDYFNGYKIEKILPNMIVFDKNGQKYYYTYNQTLNTDYQVAKIKLPNEISKSDIKTNNSKENKVKQYHSISKQELLQKLLQKKLKNMR